MAPGGEAAALALFLTGGYISHDTPIVLNVVREYGLPVKEGIPPQVDELIRKFVVGACERLGVPDADVNSSEVVRLTRHRESAGNLVIFMPKHGDGFSIEGLMQRHGGGLAGDSSRRNDTWLVNPNIW